MGLDIKHQAIPNTPDILRRCELDLEYTYELTYIGSYDPEHDEGSMEEYFKDEAIFPVLQSYPELVSLNLFFRAWDELSYLLNETYRVDSQSALMEPAVKGIRGGEKWVGDIQLLSPTEMAEIVGVYADVDQSVLFEYFDPKVMAAKGVYKMFDREYEYTDEYREGLWGLFSEIRQFYQSVNQKGYCVISEMA